MKNKISHSLSDMNLNCWSFVIINDKTNKKILLAFCYHKFRFLWQTNSFANAVFLSIGKRENMETHTVGPSVRRSVMLVHSPLSWWVALIRLVRLSVCSSHVSIRLIRLGRLSGCPSHMSILLIRLVLPSHMSILLVCHVGPSCPFVTYVHSVGLSRPSVT